MNILKRHRYAQQSMSREVLLCLCIKVSDCKTGKKAPSGRWNVEIQQLSLPLIMKVCWGGGGGFCGNDSGSNDPVRHKRSRSAREVN